jgi:hypothetical protein
MPGKGSDSDRWPETTFIVFLWNSLELWKLPVLAGCLERVISGHGAIVSYNAYGLGPFAS